MSSLLQMFGLFLFIHDIRDVPDVSRLHHWMIGATILLLGIK